MPGSHDNRRGHMDQICMHQQLSRNWQLAAQNGGYARGPLLTVGHTPRSQQALMHNRCRMSATSRPHVEVAVLVAKLAADARCSTYLIAA